jgi:indolepyruvate decarboxylase
VDLPCARIVLERDPPADPEALGACAEEILAHLAAAARPVLMVGVEVRRFGLEERVAKLARRLGIPVVTSLLGRGLLVHEDIPLAGTYLGPAGDEAVSTLVEESDALFLLGEIVADTTLGVSGRRVDLRHAIHAFDSMVTISYHTYPGIPLAALIEALQSRAQPLAQARRAPTRLPPANRPADDQPIAPIDIAAALNDLMGRHGRFPVACDVGDCLFTAMDLLPTDHVAPGYYATMGFGVPAAMGVQIATRRRPSRSSATAPSR